MVLRYAVKVVRKLICKTMVCAGGVVVMAMLLTHEPSSLVSSCFGAGGFLSIRETERLKIISLIFELF